MSFENSTGLNVYTSYGRRNTGGTSGSETTDGSTREYSITLTGETLNGTFLPKVVLPKGSRLKGVVLRVDEAFVISTGGAVQILGAGSDGQGLLEAELEAVGTKVPATAASGNWVSTSATGTTAAGPITFMKVGTIDATKGKATVVLTFFNKSKG